MTGPFLTSDRSLFLRVIRWHMRCWRQALSHLEDERSGGLGVNIETVAYSLNILRWMDIESPAKIKRAFSDLVSFIDEHKENRDSLM